MVAQCIKQYIGRGVVFASTAVFALTVYGQVSIAPIEVPSDINMAQAELGKKLFFDPRLSKS
ncbi:MAG: hypothetical protein OIF35_12905, partial [Cellvibrionaceae bacterium]|nr:hypothetical protein [Cellvibrionaceae bacterium]